MVIFGQVNSKSVISLARYAQIIGYGDCAFFGISSEENIRYGCREIWTKSQRDDIAYYLSEAQDEMERILEYPLQPKWFADERHKFSPILISTWGKILDSGIMVEEDLSLGILVDYTSVDPAEISIMMVEPGYALTEIHIFYPDTDIEIIPSNIYYDTDSLIIEIPRCRLVAYEKLANPPEGWIYGDDTNFEDEVDIKRIYNDTSVQAKLIYSPERSCKTDCSETSEDICQYIANREIGEFKIFARSNFCLKIPDYIELNYLAGLESLPKTAETALIRLAHSKMPTEPCGCDVSQRLWKRDRNIPEILTKERIDCPFGMSDGAWMAWKWTTNLALVRASALYRVA